MPVERSGDRGEERASLRITPSPVRVPILSPGSRTWVLLLGERVDLAQRRLEAEARRETEARMRAKAGRETEKTPKT